MFRTLTATLVATFALAATLGLGACSDDHDPMDHGSRGADDGENAVGSPDEPNTADLLFVTMMIPHHEQAIEMSDIVLTSPGVSGEVTGLAARIKAAQRPEVELMQGWLEGWGGDAIGQGMDGMGDLEGMAGMGGDGMLDPDEMDDLRAARGRPAEQLFLQGMIEHHEGAIDMAEEELDDGQFEPALALAQDVIAEQRAEIDAMEELLR